MTILVSGTIHAQFSLPMSRGSHGILAVCANRRNCRANKLNHASRIFHLFGLESSVFGQRRGEQLRSGRAGWVSLDVHFD